MAMTGLTASLGSSTFASGSFTTPRTFGPVLDEPEAITLERGESFVPRPNAVSIYRQWWRPCGGSRGVVVLVHGLKDHSARYGALAESLVARGFAVHGFDLRGHARSSGPRGWVDAFDDYVDDLESVVRCARVRDRRGPLFVFGHGMGGVVATLWALDRAPHV